MSECRVCVTGDCSPCPVCKGRQTHHRDCSVPVLGRTVLGRTETVDLVEVDEEVPVEVDGPEYEYACIGSIVCEPLLDLHGVECERVNQEARVDFYEEVAASRFGATGWTGVGR